MLLKRVVLLLSVFAAVLLGRADGVEKNPCPVVRIVPERMPDLTMPRSGHNIFFVNGELTVIGGHTTHFVPTPTAEYFSGGEWHMLPMAYSHDNGFAVGLPSGEVFIGGGHAEELGVGQTYTMELYTPQKHSFEGFGCLDRRRVLANATPLEDGRVIIAGNHYADDAVGCYDGRAQVQHLKDVRQGYANPYILPTANDDAVIVGGNDTRDRAVESVWAERVNGDAFRVPLLEQWHLVYTDQPFSSKACFIGNEEKSDYAYLLTATDSSGQLGIVLMRDTCFSLLPTACPIPMTTQWGRVFYKGPVVTDTKHQRAYVMGVDSLFRRQYVLAIDYAKRPAALTLHYTDTLEHATITIPVVTPDGDLILAGGIPNDNYKPLATVWCYHFGTPQQAVSARPPLWIWLLVAAAMVALCAYYVIRSRRKKIVAEAPLEMPLAVADDSPVLPANNTQAALMARICQLMDDERLYLRSDLKVQDVAVRLGTNSSYVSECINSTPGQTFSLFINAYRVRHAQQLLSQQPDMKTASIATASGFSSEASFFRNFKAIAGMTPREWIGRSQLIDN